MNTRTYGPVFDEQRDGERIRTGLLRVRNCLLAAAIRNEWLTVDEIKARIEEMYHTTISWGSVDADIRHWKKPAFGSLDIRRQKRGNISEYRLFADAKFPAERKPVGAQEKLFEMAALRRTQEGIQ